MLRNSIAWEQYYLLSINPALGQRLAYREFGSNCHQCLVLVDPQW